LAKYDPNGSLLWVAPANGQSGGDAEGVALDGNDDPYLCGAFGTVVTFYNGAGGIGGAPHAIGTGGKDAFLAKYSSAGTPQWVVSSGGNSQHDADARSVAIDRARNKAFVTGTFSGSPAFGGIPPLGPTA